jgi:hypothetical protein
LFIFEKIKDLLKQNSKLSKGPITKKTAIDIMNKGTRVAGKPDMHTVEEIQEKNPENEKLQSEIKELEATLEAKKKLLGNCKVTVSA